MLNINILNKIRAHSLHLLVLLSPLPMTQQLIAADLYEVYQQALQQDAQYKQAIAANLAAQEQKPQAFSQLLPNVTLTAGTQNQNLVSSGGLSFGSQTEFDTNAHNYNFSLTQPLFRWDRYLTLKQADASIRRSNTELLAAEQDLMVRVADAYFNVLAAMDSLTFAQAEKRSLSRQLDQANQRFEVGLTAITDVREAQAGYHQAVAGEIVAENAVDNNREALREIIGDYIPEIAVLMDTFPLLSPDPASIEEWTDTALEQNLDILAAMYAVDEARQQIKITKAGHLPTLDLQASKSYNKSGGRFGSNKNKSENIGLQLTVPMFQGGSVRSRTREAVHQLDRQLQVLEQRRRASQRETRQAYLGVISGISQVEAFKQLLISRETALEATEAGFEVGRRTAVDIVDSERFLFESRRDYARARYDYLINTLRLKQAAGILSPEDIVGINQWLN